MLSSSARRLQLTKERQHLTVRKKVRWCRAIPFQHFPRETVIFKNARISILTTRVFGKYPRVSLRQICPQMKKLVFLETWKMNWGSAKATNHCGTFKCSPECITRTRADKAMWQGKWQPAHPSYSVWVRTEPPAWHQAPDPNHDYRYVLEPGKGHTIHVDYGVHWGNEKHCQPMGARL